MRVDFLRTFYWVATLKSIAAAATKENLAHATVSHRIDMLEDELKVMLFERKGRGIALTASGTQLLRELPAFFKTCQQLAKRVGAPEPDTGVLRIGVIESVLHGSFLIPWLEQLRTEQGDLGLELTVDTTPNLIAAIEHGALDIIVAALAAGDNLRKQSLPPLPLVFVGKSGVHDAATYTLPALARHDLLTFQVSSLPHTALLDRLARSPEIEKPRVHAISSISAMRALVASGFGVAMLPRCSLDQATASAGLRELDCEIELDALPLCLSWHEDPSRPHIRAIVESLERAARANSQKNGTAKTPRGAKHEKLATKVGSPSRPRRSAERDAHAPEHSRGKLPRPHERSRGKLRAR